MTTEQTIDVGAWVPDGLLPLLAVNDDEAARLFGVSVRLWQRLDAGGEIPTSVRFGKCKRWVVDDLRAWAAAGCPTRPRWIEFKRSNPTATATGDRRERP